MYTYYYVGALDVGIQLVSFFFAYALETEKTFDLTGSLAFIVVVLASLRCQSFIHQRQIILSLLVILWALRLGSFLFYRVLITGGDSRFDKYKTNPFAFLMVWLIQAAWVYFTVFPVIIVNQKRNNPNIGWLDFVGIAVWIVGFTFEIVADWQKWQFKNNPENKGKFIDEGLWSISQHPNYFGEILLWIGIFIIAASALQGWEWSCILSPVFVMLLITQVSGVPQLKQRGLERYGEMAAYQHYISTVPELIPFIGRP